MDQAGRSHHQEACHAACVMLPMAAGHQAPAKAVVFDLGSVSSVCLFELFQQIEQENSLKEDTFRATIKAAGTDGSHAVI